jgi:hypothetical protein
MLQSHRPTPFDRCGRGSLYRLPILALLCAFGLPAQQVVNPPAPGAGGAASVSGTTNQIVASPTTGNVVLSLASPLAVGAAGTAATLCWGDSSTNLTCWGDAASGYNGTWLWPTAAGSSGNVLTLGAGGQTSWAAGGVSPTTNQNLRSIVADFGDFTSTASALSASAQACVAVPFAGTIVKAQLIAAPSGSATVDVRTVAFASYTGPSSTSTITASDTPALSSAASYTDSTLTGWTTALTANSVVCFYLTSPTTVTGVQARVTVAAN